MTAGARFILALILLMLAGMAIIVGLWPAPLLPLQPPITAAGGGNLMWSWWATIEGVETFNFLMHLVLGTAAVLAAVGTVGNVLAERQLDRLKSQKEAAQQAKQVAREQELRQQIAEREQELREVQAQQRPRTITEEQRHTLIGQLQLGPKGKVEIQFPAGNAEAERFAEQLWQVLKSAGWPVNPEIYPTIYGNIPTGLHLVAKGPEMAPYGILLQNTLRGVGIDSTVSIDQHLFKEVVHFVVGAKSWPRN